MYIHRLNKASLEELDRQGYGIVPCKNSNEQLDIYTTLKSRGRCVRAAKIRNREGQMILFVLTKEKKNKAGV